ncbi:nucleotide-binding universal stress UspA family protein [Halopiger aswanensis]|uniref:Nucleotide-binding universal stress UspA family protein n=1 Tax=Halopiger aswanensis TaxID=148449 RepID=A0A419W195_9EURY|nr:nucleotide-binding universal stress UspA family protein [Halopiger aswanensis]
MSDVVAEVAGPAHATVHLVCPFSTDEFEKTIQRLEYDADSPPEPDELAKRSQSVRQAAAGLRDPTRNYGMPITVHGRITDNTGEAIVDTANEVNADRVVICGGNRSPTGKAIFGSTAQYALLNAPCPVTFVRSD